MNEWKEFTILDFAEIHNENRVPLSKMERVGRQGIFPYYGASGIIDHVNDFLFEGEFVLISEDGENLKSRRTPIAFKANGKFWVNNHAHILKGKKDFHNNLLIYYFQNLDLNPFITGAVQPKLNKANLLSIPMYLPKDEIKQKAIAYVLSSLDDKINLLYRQNKTLEAIAQTLFRQWLVEEAKEDWEEKPLSCIAEHKKVNVRPEKNPATIYNHYSIPSFDEGKHPVKELGSEIMSNKYQVIPSSILISKLNPRFPRVWAIPADIEENSICSTEFQVVYPIQLKYYGFIYCLLKSKQIIDELIGAAGGTSGSHQRVKPEDIFNITFKMPDLDKVDDFNKITSQHWQRINNNKNQIRTLEKLRGVLLPKLMNGEVSVQCKDNKNLMINE
jgi:type I restriction enzyme, S subunit